MSNHVSWMVFIVDIYSPSKRIISFADTYSLSMTRQVTASAAITLAVLMSSLDKKITQPIRKMTNNVIDDYSITHCSTFQMLSQSCNGTTAAARLILPYPFNGEGSENIRLNRQHC